MSYSGHFLFSQWRQKRLTSLLFIDCWLVSTFPLMMIATKYTKSKRICKVGSGGGGRGGDNQGNSLQGKWGRAKIKKFNIAIVGRNIERKEEQSNLPDQALSELTDISEGRTKYSPRQALSELTDISEGRTKYSAKIGVK